MSNKPQNGGAAVDKDCPYCHGSTTHGPKQRKACKDGNGQKFPKINGHRPTEAAPAQR